MTQPDAEADWADPEQWRPSRAGVPLDAPEADAVEQAAPLRPEEDSVPRSLSPEVNEADAVEQSRIVEEDDEYDR